MGGGDVNARIGQAVIYTQTARYIEYDVPFHKYFVETPFGVDHVNVHKRHIAVYGEELAVRMAAWGSLRERNPHINNIEEEKRRSMRSAFLAKVTFTLIW